MASNMVEGDRSLVGFGIAFILMGIVSFLVDSQTAPGVPRWLLHMAEATFVFGGLGIMFFGLGVRRLAQVFGFLTAASLLFIFHWGAFGPGERVCFESGTISMSEADCRRWLRFGSIFFDIGILILILIAIAVRRK